jgi:hypothetical protein
MRAARERPRPFDVVLVDDLSRLNRDVFAMGRIVFDEFPAFGIVTIDCQSGTRSDAPHARTQFAAVGMAADAFLQMVKHETPRGLEGRALGKFHTGGRCYGYATVDEPNPPDREHPRKVVVIDEREAATVRRVFDLYLDDLSPREIARLFNREQIRAPYDGRGYSKGAGRGWRDSTIRSMLRNERYIGRFVWNKREWNRAGAEKRRRSRARPESEWIKTERPGLAIVDASKFERVQAKLAERSVGAGVPRHRDGYRTSAISGLLRCGECGNRMSAYGVREKGGFAYRNFACSANREKGADVCPNSMSISERKAIAALITTARQSVAQPAFRDAFEAGARENVVDMNRSNPSREVEALAGELRANAAKRSRLANLIADGAGELRNAPGDARIARRGGAHSPREARDGGEGERSARAPSGDARPGGDRREACRGRALGGRTPDGGAGGACRPLRTRDPYADDDRREGVPPQRGLQNRNGRPRRRGRPVRASCSAKSLRKNWLRGQDLNLRPSGYEPDELPGCSTPRHRVGRLSTSDRRTGQVDFGPSGPPRAWRREYGLCARGPSHETGRKDGGLATACSRRSSP